MKQVSGTTSLMVALMAGWFVPVNVSAAPQAVFLRLKGVGVGSSPAAGGSDVQVLGNYAYVASGGLEIFSVTNPSAPLWVGSYGSHAPVNAVRVVGPYAYLAEGTVQTLTNDPGTLEIVDVSDTANPARVGSVDTLGRANSVRVANNYAFVAESVRWTGSNLLGALEIFDVSTPTNPVRVATFDTAGSATSVDVSGGHAYLADGVTDLQVIDVSDPHNPWRAGVYHSDSSHNACGAEAGGPASHVQVLDNLAYSSGNNGVNVLDVSDPAHPAQIGNNFCLPAQGFHVSGQYAYAMTWVSGANTFLLRVLDASDPTRLVTVGGKENWGSTRLQVVDRWVYRAGIPLLVYEISAQPVIESLSIAGGMLVLTWENAPGFVLQRTSSLSEPHWSNVPGSESASRVELPLGNGNEFFRLSRL